MKNSSKYAEDLVKIRKYVAGKCSAFSYSTHHMDHIERVTATALYIGRKMNADLTVLEAAALLHDVGRFKEDENSCHAEISAEEAYKLLNALGWPQDMISSVTYAVRVHRYNLQIVPDTLEAKILQDADKLDALGAVGIARILSHAPETRLYAEKDPFCLNREPSDNYTIDHFYKKILKLRNSMNTEAGRKIAEKRDKFTRKFLEELKKEIFFPDSSGNDE
jgi:uncharacterized protein